MTVLSEPSKDLLRYILLDQQPVICHDEATWRRFMNDGDNLLVAHDLAGQFQVITVFLGFNYGTVDNPRFFQTTCLGADSEKHPHYSPTWQKAVLRHRCSVKCGELLTDFEVERAAGIDRSWEFIDCNIVPGEIQFLLKSEADALKAMPKDKHHWQRRGRMIVFCFNTELNERA
ncbi:hypothetical protein Lepto7376_1524 [[Leptolyngbya] sp. PCC 7376]|uniref:hypothetical protein n=1 Tax=[Leptolyngbya] sp. PCC 7376 TaxID=111781 RepID=UPI00029EC730|nr:hypothetical protein [[Leptolyngbya] sp. PCC 7376]AFY37867.1 hypothetical protein Lepto7376_1524 [[Leptolyngbya] sp. PCC 7376]